MCKILGIKDTSTALGKINTKSKGTVTSGTLGGAQSMLTVNESGLYSLIFSSRKKEAEVFKDWVFDEVLPSIRRTGAYLSDDITKEQSKWLLENQIIEKLRRASRGERVNIGTLVNNIINTNDIRYFHKESYNYIINYITDNKLVKVKDQTIN